ncbi:MAG: carbon-nitrogen hydrolase family protein [Chloroflexota bacterium]
MRVAVAQMDCVLGDVPANLERIEALADRAARRDGARLVVLPECATTGYFVGDRVRELATTADGPVMGRLAGLADSLGIHLAVGVIEAAGPDVYDSLALFAPGEGLLATYRKVHLFAGERAMFRPGGSACLVDTPLGRLGLTVCYDLLFPEYVRGLVLRGAQLIVNGTNWITDPGRWAWAGPARPFGRWPARGRSRTASTSRWPHAWARRQGSPAWAIRPSPARPARSRHARRCRGRGRGAGDRPDPGPRSLAHVRDLSRGLAAPTCTSVWG